MENEIIAAVVSGINSEVIIAAMAVAAAVCIAAIATIAIGYRDVVLAVLRAGANAAAAAVAGLVALARTAVSAGQKRRSRQTQQHPKGNGALSAGGMIGSSAAD